MHITGLSERMENGIPKQAAYLAKHISNQNWSKKKTSKAYKTVTIHALNIGAPNFIKQIVLDIKITGIP
jgi:hypothetical protein